MQHFQPDSAAPLLIFGGPYSNLQATEALLAVAEAEGIPAGNILCTGDLIAYCASPEETINRIRDAGITVVMGNCEESIGNDAADCGCGFDEGTACDLLSAAWYNFSKPRVSQANKTWMRQLPQQIRFDYHGARFTAIHGGADQINQFIFDSDSTDQKQQQIAELECDIVLAGHSGIPFGNHTDAGLWLNAGVIGMPANDATTDGWYMMIRPAKDALQITWHRLEYDYKSAAATMAAKGLNNDYQQALSSGLWPSLDVLPTSEQAQTGHNLSPEPMSFILSPAG